LQFLEEENNRLESEMKSILNELNYRKDLSNLMHDKVAHLETCLQNSKVLLFPSSNLGLFA